MIVCKHCGGEIVKSRLVYPIPGGSTYISWIHIKGGDRMCSCVAEPKEEGEKG
jgi:hypothetical protein